MIWINRLKVIRLEAAAAMANRNCKEDRLFDFTMDDRMMGCGCDGGDYVLSVEAYTGYKS